MLSVLKRLTMLVVMAPVVLTSGGCLRHSFGISQHKEGDQDIVAALAVVTTDNCDFTSLSAHTLAVACIIKFGATEPVRSAVESRMNLDFVDDAVFAATDFNFRDPVVIQVAAGAAGFKGTYTDNAGASLPLSITAGLSSLPIDANSSLVAEPGMQMVLLDFQSHLATRPGTYSYAFSYAGGDNTIKAITVAIVLVDGKYYYPPLVPCVASFAEVSPIRIPLASSPVEIAPEALGPLAGCAGKTYRFVASGTAANYGGIWWNSPPGSEAGWGINFAHQGDTLFASWFTFGLDGKPTWLVTAAGKTGPNVYAGDLYTGTGPAFNAVPFDPAKVVPAKAGTATFAFTDNNTATFAYTFDGISQVKNITRQQFGPTMPICSWGTEPNLALATNFQDIWWNSPAGSESGWGINFNHQGDTIFATWFTFDLDGKPTWLVAAVNKSAPNVYTGDLYSGTGPAFNAVPFDPAKVAAVKKGTATLTFANGNAAAFSYTVGGVAQTKQVTRQVFTAPGTICQ